MGGKILIIDDDRSLLELLSTYLGRNGYEVRTAAHPDDGLRILGKYKPDLVILDVMLPDRDGFATCREIRRESDVPVIMLTARGDVTDRIVGLEIGADDYLPKPFEPRELLARMGSILRRGRATDGAMRLVRGPLVMDPDKRSVTLSGQPVDLSTIEFDALWALASHPNRVFTRDQLMNSLKGVDWSAFDRSIDVLISRLRQKLADDPKRPRLIKTIWGTGYKFVGGSDGES